MMTPRELRAKAATLQASAQKIYDTVKADKDGRDFTEDELREYDGAIEQADSLLKRADDDEAREQKLNDLAARSKAKPEPKREERSSGSGVETQTVAATGATGDDERASFGDFLRCVAILGDSKASYRQKEIASDQLENLYGATYSAWDSDKRSRETRDMAQSSGVTGGYMVPSRFYAQLMEIAAPQTIVRQRAMVLPMGADEVEIPMLDQTTAQSAGTPAWFGGVVGTWTAEAAQINETEPGFRQAKLTAHELTGYTEISRNLMANSAISIDPLVRRLFGGAVAWHEDYAFLRGNGTGKPLGVLNAPALVSTGTARGSATAISFANARAVWVKVLEEARSSGIWIVSQAAESALLDMTGTANSVFVPSGYYVTGTNANAAGQAINYALLGRPVLVSSKMPALNTLGDFGFYDFSKYIVGDRGVMEVASSEHFKFRNNQIAFRFVHRVGGMPWLNDGITLEDGSTKVSPFVSLTVN